MGWVELLDNHILPDGYAHIRAHFPAIRKLSQPLVSGLIILPGNGSSELKSAGPAPDMICYLFAILNGVFTDFIFVL